MSEGTRQARDDIRALTSIRFFAAMYVLIFHSGAGFAREVGLPGYVVNFLDNGWFGVSTFFVLSGFILTYQYHDRLTGGANLWAFGVARFARLYPVYVLALLIAYPLQAYRLDAQSMACTLLLIQAWGPTESSFGYTWVGQAWSLSVETAFYLLFPLLIFGTRGIGRGAVLAALGVISVVMVALGTPSLRPSMAIPVFSSLLEHLPLPLLRLLEFIFGILLCRLFLTSETRQSGSGPVLASTVLLVVLLTVANNPFVLAVATVVVGFIILQLASVTGFVHRVLSSRALVALGGASYAVYILHGPIREWMRALIPASTLSRALYPLVVIAVSLLVFYLFEGPARRLIRRAAGPLAKPATGGADRQLEG